MPENPSAVLQQLVTSRKPSQNQTHTHLQRFENWLDAPPRRASHVDDDGKAESPRRFRRNPGQIGEDPRSLVRLQAFELGLGSEFQEGTTTPIPMGRMEGGGGRVEGRKREEGGRG